MAPSSAADLASSSPPSNQSNTFLVLRPAGRLGNQLTTFAYLMAHCLEHGGKVLNLPFAEYGGWFEGTVNDPLCRFPAGDARWAGPISRRILSAALRAVDKVDARTVRRIGRINKGSLSEEPNVSILAKHRYIVPTSWWVADEASLRNHVPAIRKFFRPVRSIREQVEWNQRYIRERGGVVIGVHIRRTDYREIVPTYFYEHEVYLDHMRQAAKLFADRNPVFFVSSDEPVHEELLSGFNFVHFKQGAVDDMYTLAACDYLIGTKSSFNTWASFFGDTPTFWIVGGDRPLVADEFIRFAPGFIPQHATRSLCGSYHPYFFPKNPTS